METDDDDDATRPETFVEHAVEGCFELFQLVIDGNPQRLKDARCWMAAGRMRSAPLRQFPGRSQAGDRVGEIPPRANRLMPAPFDDVPGDPTTVRLFAVAREDFSKFRFTQTRDQFCRRFSLSRVKPQIEGTVRRKAETSRRIGQLVGRQPQVEQNAIDSRDVAAGQNLREFGITGLLEVTRKARELKGRNVQHQGVAVKTD